MGEADDSLQAVIDWWEERHAPLYASAQLRLKEREELGSVQAAIRSGDFEGARPVLERWRTYHESVGDYADTLTSGFAHHRLAELLDKVLKETG